MGRREGTLEDVVKNLAGVSCFSNWSHRPSGSNGCANRWPALTLWGGRNRKMNANLLLPRRKIRKRIESGELSWLQIQGCGSTAWQSSLSIKTSEYENVCAR